MPAITPLFMDRGVIRLLAGLGLAAFMFGYYMAVI